jgi:hypothetical protein
MNNRFVKRRARRRAIWAITRTLEQILDLEIGYLYSIPDTNANEERWSESELFVGMLDSAVESLRYIE